MVSEDEVIADAGGVEPALTVLSCEPANFQAEWDAYWTCVAQAATEAISRVSPGHPDLPLLRSHARDARVAAGLPPAWTPPHERPHLEGYRPV